jgi:hypothetical protein
MYHQVFSVHFSNLCSDKLWTYSTQSKCFWKRCKTAQPFHGERSRCCAVSCRADHSCTMLGSTAIELCGPYSRCLPTFYLRMETDSALKHCVRFCTFKHWMMYEVQNLSRSECDMPWSKPNRIECYTLLVLCQHLFHIWNGWFQSLSLFLWTECWNAKLNQPLPLCHETHYWCEICITIIKYQFCLE